MVNTRGNPVDLPTHEGVWVQDLRGQYVELTGTRSVVFCYANRPGGTFVEVSMVHVNPGAQIRTWVGETEEESP